MTGFGIVCMILLTITGISCLGCFLFFSSEWNSIDSFDGIWWLSSFSFFIFGLVLFFIILDGSYNREIKKESPITLQTLEIDGVVSQFVAVNGSILNITHRTHSIYEDPQVVIREYKQTPYKIGTRPLKYIVINGSEVYGFNSDDIIIEGEKDER